MPVKMLGICSRKPGTTFEDFKLHLETKHVPLVQELTGNLYPTQHRRFYNDHAANADAAAMHGEEIISHHDVIVEMTFRDIDHFTAFQRVRSEADEVTRKRWLDDELAFADVSKLRISVVKEIVETTTMDKA